MGTAVRMGPAYFPAVLGGLLAVLGVMVLAESFAIEGPPVPTVHFRPLVLISVACVVYGYLMKPLGLVARDRGAGVHQRLRRPRVQVEGSDRSCTSS